MEVYTSLFAQVREMILMILMMNQMTCWYVHSSLKPGSGRRSIYLRVLQISRGEWKIKLNKTFRENRNAHVTDRKGTGHVGHICVVLKNKLQTFNFIDML